MSGKIIKVIAFQAIGFALLLELSMHFIPDMMPPIARYMVDIPGQWHPILGVAQAPNRSVTLFDSDSSFHVTTSDFGLGGPGFRDVPISNKNPVVVLGDSFTWGAGVEQPDIWCELLEKKFGVDFVNTAYGGYGTTQERLMLENWGIRLNPRGVILQIYLGNDFEENQSWRYGFHVGQGTFKSWEMGMRAWFSKNSRVYEMVKYHIMGRFFKRGTYGPLFGAPGAAHAPTEADFSALSSSMENNPGWTIMREDIKLISNLCREKGAWFAVVIFPTEEQVIPKPSWLAKGLDLNRQNKMIEAYCESLKIPAYDITDALIRNNGSQIYGKTNGHFTKLGHQVIADFLEAAFRTKLGKDLKKAT